MNRSLRLPRHRMAPGQMALWDRPTFTVLLQNGRTLQVLPGGRQHAPAPRPATPVVAIVKRAA